MKNILKLPLYGVLAGALVCASGCATLDQWTETFEGLFADKPEQPQPEPPAPSPDPGPTWKTAKGAPDELIPGKRWRVIVKGDCPVFEYRGGGNGLYKRTSFEDCRAGGDSKLWLLPANNSLNGKRLMPYHVKSAGVYQDAEGTQLVKWLRWPGGTGFLSGKPMDGNFVIDKVTYDSGISAAARAGFFHGGMKIRGVVPTVNGQYLIVKDVFDQVVMRLEVFDIKVRQQG